MSFAILLSEEMTFWGLFDLMVKRSASQELSKVSVKYCSVIFSKELFVLEN